METIDLSINLVNNGATNAQNVERAIESQQGQRGT